MEFTCRRNPCCARNKTSLALVVFALVIGGVSAQASGLLDLKSGGYLVCVNPKTTVVTHPSRLSCPGGYKKLILGARGQVGAVGLNGPAGPAGKDGRDGIDGKTLWNGVKDPESTWGAPGDMFINATTKTLFGPKGLTTGWPTGVSMVGPQGVKGETGAQGPGGGSGPAGATGATGVAGATGPAGATGATGSNATLACNQGGTCIIGDTGPGGGIVFYVQAATAVAPWRYLEAAPNTWSGGTADPLMVWCSNSTQFVHSLTTGATASVNTLTAIGKGFYNTKLMLGSCTYGAANMAATYNGGGKSDWFLPSQDELNQLYIQQTVVGGFPVSIPQVEAYWSSTEDVYDHAFYQNFPTGFQSTNVKSNGGYVRPVRAF